MSRVDINKVKPIVPPPNPKDNIRASFTALGESVTVRDFNQRVLFTAHILANGCFQVADGILEPEELGEYILRTTGHPARTK